jgi:hypothetical protein
MPSTKDKSKSRTLETKEKERERKQIGIREGEIKVMLDYNKTCD